MGNCTFKKDIFILMYVYRVSFSALWDYSAHHHTRTWLPAKCALGAGPAQHAGLGTEPWSLYLPKLVLSLLSYLICPEDLKIIKLDK